MMKYFFVAVFILQVWLVSDANAARKKQNKPSCPKFIADLNSGEYRQTKNNYKCFSSASAAQKDGFVQGASVGDTVTFTGSTDQSTASFRVGKPAKVTYSYTGESNFIVVPYVAATGERESSLVNEIGVTSGSVSIPDAGVYYLDVTADGPWSITIAPR